MASPYCRTTGVKEDDDLLICFTGEYFPGELLYWLYKDKKRKQTWSRVARLSHLHLQHSLHKLKAGQEYHLYHSINFFKSFISSAL